MGFQLENSFVTEDGALISNSGARRIDVTFNLTFRIPKRSEEPGHLYGQTLRLTFAERLSRNRTCTSH